jgi:hypothetical protein
MNCLCPACRRPTRIEPHLVDFFTRCDRCGILLRPRLPADATPLDPDDPTSIELTAKVVPIGRVREVMANANGTLADLLGASRLVKREGADEKRVVPVTAAPVEVAAMPVRTDHVLKQPQAIRRALLRQHHHALGILGICGTGLVAIVAAGAISLKAHALMHPRAVRAGQELRVGAGR